MSLQYLVDDIHALLNKLEDGEDVTIKEELYEEFGKTCIEALKRQMQPRKNALKGTVRMSNIGRPDRILYYEVNHPELKGELQPSDKVRFMYGDMVESLMLFLMEASGNEICDKQRRVQLSVGTDEERVSIKGSCDGSSRGTVFDIKSASSYAFNTKFAKGGLEQDDPFGYRLQLAGYRTAIQDESVPNNSTVRGKDVDPSFFVVDKSTGQMKISEPSLPTNYEVKERLEHVMLMLEEPNEPQRCHAPIPKGTKGNMVLPKACGWCDFKFHCHRDANNGAGLRAFEYKTYKGLEPTYFTEVVDTPRVTEIT